MTFWRLILRSLRFHARSHLGVVLGAIVGSAALVGALVVGDSVRGSLREMALLRVGNANLALPAGDRFFRDQLATELSSGSISAAPLLQLSATAARADGAARANRVQVIGIDQRLRQLQPSAPSLKTSSEEVVLNTALAAQLGAKAGDIILLRVEKPSLLS